MISSDKNSTLNLLSSPFGAAADTALMEQALVLAQAAAEHDEVPIGALVVNADGKIIGTAANATEAQNTQSAHAEVLALSQAGIAVNSWQLTGCWLYVTLEPCFMCMGLVYLSRLAGVVYGARSPLFGAQLDSSRMVSVYKVNTVAIIGGVCADKAGEMLKKFFKEKRSTHDCRR